MTENHNEKYTIDNAKNDIQNLQSQNLYDFQEIKRLDSLINDYDKRISQAINFNNQINKKIQDEYENLKKSVLDIIKCLEDKLSTDSGGSGLTQRDVENIVNQLISGIQTQITLILDRINRLENNSSIEEIKSQIALILDRIKHLEDNSSSEDNKPIVLCKNAGLSGENGQETESTTRIATDFIPVTIEGDLSICSKTFENYMYLVRYYDINKEFLSVAGGDWVLDGNTTVFTPIEGVKFEDVKFIRLVYKSKYSDHDVINTINGTIEVEEDGNARTLQMHK